jgi:hypothetical protein
MAAKHIMPGTSAERMTADQEIVDVGEKKLQHTTRDRIMMP